MVDTRRLRSGLHGPRCRQPAAGLLHSDSDTLHVVETRLELLACSQSGIVLPKSHPDVRIQCVTAFLVMLLPY